MDVSRFIGRRIVNGGEQSFTKIIMRMAVAAIALSMAVMLVSTTLISGFKKEITSKIIGFWGHIHITDGGLNNTIEQMRPIAADPDYLKELRDIGSVTYQAPVSVLGFEIPNKVQTKTTNGGVDHVQQFTFLPGIVSTRSEFGAVILKGVGEDYDWSRMQPYMREGQPIDLRDSIDNEIIISTTIARNLKIDLGQRIRVSFFKGRNQIKRVFVVTGMYNTGLEEFDKQFAIVDFKKIRPILGFTEGEVGGFEVFLEDIADIDTYSEYIYYEVLPPNVLAQSIKTRLSSIFEWLNLQDVNMQFILLLMIIVAIINMTTALLILILDRTKMIGILKAVGGTDWQIRKIFLYQAAYIILFGMLLGNLLGLGLAALQKWTGFIQLDEANYYLTQAPVSFDWMNIILINLGTFFFTLLFLLLPTYLITKIRPVKVLSFD